MSMQFVMPTVLTFTAESALHPFGVHKFELQYFVVDRRYYKKQDELISAFEGIHLDNSKLDCETTRIRLRRQASRLAKLSFFVNFVSLSFFRDHYGFIHFCSSVLCIVLPRPSGSVCPPVCHVRVFCKNE